jgi:hypothetical protein
LEGLKERDHSEDIGMDGKIILKVYFKEIGWGLWTSFICLRIGILVGCCIHGNAPSGFIKCVEFLD